MKKLVLTGIIFVYLLSEALSQTMNEGPFQSGITVQIVSPPSSLKQPIAGEEKIDLLINECYQRLSELSNNIEIHGQRNFTEIQSKFQVKSNLENQLRCRISVVESSMGIANFQFFSMKDQQQFVQILQRISQDNWRLLIQKSAEVTRRQRVPNDPEFNQQKYLSLIQMPDAWDFGVTSETRAGDTAVIAIIDDGVDTGHVDLASNLFRNPKEIPWNGIDEDSNGYVDDYWGWNGGDNSPLIFNRESTRFGHGTSVASVMMASGNNAKGISGILWDTKLLVTHCYPTNGGSADIGVINCMVYIFKQKKLYLQSKGTKGVNVVAVNMSVGIDNAFPDEFPIWCSMYDSLASVGVMCASSTTNLNIDIDDPNKGDIPSLCPSKGLIVVSSADENKNRASSGYGSTSVDIHATGQNMYLAKPTQTHSYPYAVESGTSFASPQVTATIAWLYSRSCNSYLTLWQTKADSAISLMRQWILTSAQPNASLSGKSTTGGYLQVYSAWEKMHQWCSANDNAYNTQNVSQRKWGIYPNPISSQGFFEEGLTVSIDGKNASLKFELLDIHGAIIMDNFRVANEEENGNTRILLQRPIPAGCYQLRVKNLISGEVQCTSLILY